MRPICVLCIRGRFICFFLLVLPVFAAAAQEPGTELPAYESTPWTCTSGPVGGLGYDVRMDPRNPDVMYVTDAWAGVFKSLDNGVSWFPSSEGLTARAGASGDGIPVFSLTIDPNNPDTLWAGTQFASAAFHSDDAGATWRSLNRGIHERALTIRGFGVQPGNSDVVYLAGEVSSWEWNGEPLPGLGLDMVKGVVYRSVDGGQNWTRIWSGDNLARYVWIDPRDPDRLYVSTGIFDREAANSDAQARDPGGVGILRSRDGGVTWEVLGVEHGFHPDDLYVGSLYLYPQNPDLLLAAAGNDPYMWYLGRAMGGVYRSDDGGDTWTEVLDEPNISAVEICEGDPQVVYAGSAGGFFRSDDGGYTWRQLGSEFWGPEGIVAGFPITHSRLTQVALDRSPGVLVGIEMGHLFSGSRPRTAGAGIPGRPEPASAAGWTT